MQSQNPNQPNQWFAIQTKPRQEHVALQNLENQGFVVYLPKTSINKHKKGQWQVTEEVLFPGYIFLALDLASQNVAPIRSTFGVRGMVRFGNKVVPIPNEVIELIQQYENQEGLNPENPVAKFKTGESLSIVSGPFEGINAVFQMSKSEDRVMVLINILGGQKAVAVDLNSVVPM